MNHANLETCRAIASEFPSSEFVLVQAIEEPTATPFIESRRQFNYRTERAFHIIAPAPTCEELGEWLGLYFKHPYVVAQSGSRTAWFLAIWNKTGSLDNGNVYRTMEVIHSIESPNETQARAEAVKLIIGQDDI